MVRPGVRGWWALLAVAAGLAPARALAAEDAPRIPSDHAVQLFREGKVEEGALLLRFSEMGGGGLASLAEQSRAVGRTADALLLWEAYLRYFPFNGLSWEKREQEEWSRAAVGYVELLARTDKPDAEWFKQSLAALEAYQQLRKALERKDAKEYTRLADEILEKHPRSIFVEPAVMTACWGRAANGHAPTWGRWSGPVSPRSGGSWSGCCTRTSCTASSRARGRSARGWCRWTTSSACPEARSSAGPASSARSMSAWLRRTGRRRGPGARSSWTSTRR
jgi:hypothetical protein